MGLHGSLLVLVEGVPADADDHAVYGAPVHAGQAPVDSAHQLIGQLGNHLLREVGRGEAFITHKKASQSKPSLFRAISITGYGTIIHLLVN